MESRVSSCSRSCARSFSSAGSSARLYRRVASSCGRITSLSYPRITARHSPGRPSRPSAVHRVGHLARAALDQLRKIAALQSFRRRDSQKREQRRQHIGMRDQQLIRDARLQSSRPANRQGHQDRLLRRRILAVAGFGREHGDRFRARSLTGWRSKDPAGAPRAETVRSRAPSAPAPPRDSRYRRGEKPRSRARNPRAPRTP